MPYMTEGEIGLEFLLFTNHVLYEPKKLLRIRVSEQNRSEYTTPDFYLPQYSGYCEVVSSRQSLESRFDKLKHAIQEGNRFTFYDGFGRKIIFTTKLLGYLGLHNNNELFVIKEIPYIEATVAGNKYYCSTLYPEYIKPISRKTLRQALKYKVIEAYYKEDISQKETANMFNISQAFVSKLILEK
uniref:Uncharacterized protein n=1 Tax=viral metagenome TaxID=1070528 RepID=A0A6H1ZQH5_9ZZZZ